MDIMRTVTKVLVMAVMVACFAQTTFAQTADEIVEKYLGAIGGRATLAKIKSRHATGTASFSSPAGELPGTIEVFSVAPNKSRTLVKLDLSVAGMGTATVDQRFDGESGFAIDSLQGNHDITGNQLENLKNAVFPSPFLNYKERGATLEFVRKEQIGGRDTFVLLLKPKAGSTLQCFIDAESSLIVKTVIVVNVPQIGGDVTSPPICGTFTTMTVFTIREDSASIKHCRVEPAFGFRSSTKVSRPPICSFLTNSRVAPRSL